MSDEQTPPVEDTSVATPEGGAEEVNWEQRFNEINDRYQGGVQEFTRKSQRLSEIEDALQGLHSEDPDTRQQAAQALGIELAEDEDTGFDDPFSAYEQRIAKLEQSLTQRSEAETQQAQQDRDIAVIDDGLLKFKKELGRDFSQHEIKMLGDAAWTNRDEKGLPNIDAVIADYKEILSIAAPRQRPRAPHVSSSGTQAEQTVRLDDPNLTRQQRHDLMYERLQANEQ